MRTRAAFPRFAAIFLLAFTLTGCSSAYANSHGDKPMEKIRVAVLTGQNNHAWMMDSPVLKNILDEAGLFETTILQTPDKKDKDKAEKWKVFKPGFASYDVILLNYNGDMWPDNIKDEFVAYISGGGRAYAFHAANNPFHGWEEYERMVGLLWRKNNVGTRLYLDDAGEVQALPAGEGPSAGHGRQHAYLVDTHDNDHPVFKGLPDQWMHAQDELYHAQRGPAENMTILMSAYSDPATRGTGVHEPIAWTIPFGEGLVLTNVMGHWWKNQEVGPALTCVGFQAVLCRSIEWLATGQVTQAVPDDFPTKDKVSTRELKPFERLSYIHVDGVPGSDPLASCRCTAPCDPDAVPTLHQYAATGQAIPGEAAAQR